MIAWTIYITFAGAVLLLLSPRAFARWIALLTTMAALALDLIELVRTPIADIAHFTTIVRVPWVLALGINYHLAIDGVSWRLLLEDVESAYWALREEKQINLPSPTASYKAWSAALGAYAERPEVRAQRDYWRAVPDSAAAEVPVDSTATGVSDARTQISVARPRAHAGSRSGPRGSR